MASGIYFMTNGDGI